MKNRRLSPRLHRPISVRYEWAGRTEECHTVDVSATGARIVTRSPGFGVIQVTLAEPNLTLEAQPVWERALGGGRRLMGIGIRPGQEGLERLGGWLEGQAAQAAGCNGDAYRALLSLLSDGGGPSPT